MRLKKQELYDLCLQTISEKVELCRDMLERIDEGSKDDTKSSAGDKFETSREMMKQEAEKISSQLSILSDQKKVLSQIDPEQSDDVISLGSYVMSDKGNYYITIPLGKLNHDGTLFYAISDQSPMARALLGKSVNDVALVNGREILVIEIV